MYGTQSNCRPSRHARAERKSPWIIFTPLSAAMAETTGSSAIAVTCRPFAASAISVAPQPQPIERIVRAESGMSAMTSLLGSS